MNIQYLNSIFIIWAEFPGDCATALGSGPSCLGFHLVRHRHLDFLRHRGDPPSCQHSEGLSCNAGNAPTNCLFIYTTFLFSILHYLMIEVDFDLPIKTQFQPVTFNNLKQECASMVMVTGLVIFNTFLHVPRGFFCQSALIS